jgi:hypothetical protein
MDFQQSQPAFLETNHMPAQVNGACTIDRSAQMEACATAPRIEPVDQVATAARRSTEQHQGVFSQQSTLATNDNFPDGFRPLAPFTDGFSGTPIAGTNATAAAEPVWPAFLRAESPALQERCFSWKATLYVAVVSIVEFSWLYLLWLALLSSVQWMLS